MKWFDHSVRLINRTSLRDVRLHTFLKLWVDWLVTNNIKPKTANMMLHFTIKETTTAIASKNRGLIVDRLPLCIDMDTPQYLMRINLIESSFLNKYDPEDPKYKAEEKRQKREMLIIFLEEICGFSDAEEVEGIVDKALAQIDSTHSIFKPREFDAKHREVRDLDYLKMDEYVMLNQFLEYDYEKIMPSSKNMRIIDILHHAAGNRIVSSRLRFIQDSMEIDIAEAIHTIANNTMKKINREKDYLRVERDKLYMSFEVGYTVYSQKQHPKPKKHGWNSQSAKASRRTS